MLKIYDTLSGRKKELPDPKKQKKVKLFVCGPTVYDYAHIGHARTYIFFDFFVKYLRRLGYEVEYVQNITDVDDKIIKRAADENKSPAEIAGFYTEAYFEDMKALGIDSVSKYAPATKFIPQIIAQVKRLIDKGFAYKIDGDGWYFDVAKFSEYGKLSRRTVLQAEDAVSRIDETVGKRNKGDFCLWKFSRANSALPPAGSGKNSAKFSGKSANAPMQMAEPGWKTELGFGRPGWHIEDTAITENYFGPQYDIHGGGVDLKFPHHEAEIAQQESASGKKPFVKIWMHIGPLLINGKKMSKSLGNFVTIRDFLKKYPAEVLRWIVLSHHYRSPINYSEELARSAEANLDAISRFFKKLTTVAGFNNENRERLGVKAVVEKTQRISDAHLNNDVNTAFKLTETFSLKSKYEEKVWNMKSSEALILKESIEKSLGTVGIPIKLPKIPSKIQKLADEREKFRASKQFSHSDGLRKEIEGLGYEIEDTPAGPFIWPK